MKTVFMTFVLIFHPGSLYLTEDQFSVAPIEFGSYEECEYYRKEMSQEVFYEFLMRVGVDQKHYYFDIESICSEGELG